jgi:hypothetical protein
MNHSMTNGALAAAVSCALAFASNSASAQTPPLHAVPAPAPPSAVGRTAMPSAPDPVGGAQVLEPADTAACPAGCPPAYGPPPPPADWAARHARGGPSQSQYLSRLEYIEGLPPPDGYVETSEIRRGLVIAGTVVTAVPWAASLSAAVGIDDGRGAALGIPVLGPWFAMPTLGTDGGARAALTLSGLTQAAGATMLLIGLAHPKLSFVKYTSARLEISAVPLPGGASVAVTY